MKPNKRRIDIRLKKSLFERITTISDQLEKTWTDVIEESLAYGLKWYEAKIKRELATQEKQPAQNQNNNTSNEEDDKDEEGELDPNTPHFKTYEEYAAYLRSISPTNKNRN